jgi:pSer/pThr/pTyr-binding forkhead associated (FHA) protein
VYKGAPQPPGASRPVGTWPPQPLAPTYPEPTSALPPYASSLPVGPVGSAAQLVVLEAGQTLVLSVQPGQRLLVGRDAYAQIRLADPAVQPRHATIERQANAWVVQDLQDASPSRLWDATGSLKPVIGATTVEAGRLLIGSALLTLYRGQP